MSKPPCKCDICGKFRKEEDCFLDEETTSDGFQVGQWLECRYCCSPSDYERYFKPREMVKE